MSQQSNYKFFQGEAWACFFLRMWIGMRLMFAGLTKFLNKNPINNSAFSKGNKILNKIKQIEEFNIGHFIIGESVLHGISKVVKQFIKILR